MYEDECVIYKGAFFQIEWYYDSEGKSQSYDYCHSCVLSQKKFLMLCQRMGDFWKILDEQKFLNKYLYGKNKMTTFEKFFEENPEQKPIYENEYNDFILSEFMLEKMSNTLDNTIVFTKISDKKSPF